MIRALTLFIICGLLSGCGGDRKEQLEEYVKEVKSKSIGSVEPLPEVKPYKTFVYSAFDLRSPFEPPEPPKQVLVESSENGISPDQYRRKEPLEQFALDALRMVGTLERQNQIWVVIVDTEGTVHRVTQGNYVGQNHGKIRKVTEEKVFITEIVPDAQGGWREQEAAMTLVE